MRINSSENISIQSNRMQRNATAIEKTLEKLSSGSKVEKASQNASSTAISATMKAQIRGISQAQRNMQDGLSVLEASNGGLNDITQLLHRGREMAVAAANDTLTDKDREASSLELEQILQAIDDTAKNLEFNTKNILGDDAAMNLHVGANPGQAMQIGTINVSVERLGLDGVSIATSDAAGDLISSIDDALKVVTGHLTKVGSEMEAIEHHLANALVFEGNMTASFSALGDTNMAKEMTEFVQQDIRQKGDLLLIKQVNTNLQDTLSFLR